jgi:hypothetical protein
MKKIINKCAPPCVFLLLFAFTAVVHSVRWLSSGAADLIVASRDDEENGRSKLEPGLKFRRLKLQDENGVVDPNGLKKARAHIELMRKAQVARGGAKGNQIQEAAIEAGSWTWLGPGNVGGRVRSILIDPSDPNRMVAGSVSGGIWRTTNGGSSWSPVNDFMANLAVNCMVMHPSNPSIMYAGTGEGFGNTDAIQGNGIFKSTNGGVTWTQLASTDNSSFNYVNRIAISPNGNTILAATVLGIFRSTDAGVSWTETTASGAYDIDFHPTDSNKAIAGAQGSVRRSTNGGVTWSSTFIGGGRIEVAYAPSDGDIVYASADITTNFSTGTGGELYRSTNGGQSFSLRNTDYEFLGKQGWYDNIVWVNPQDANFVIVGGIRLWRSTDGGTTLTQISTNSPDDIHSDQHWIVEHPSFNNNTNKTVFIGNDGGVYKATNISTADQNGGWTELNNSLGITQYYGAAGNTTTGIIIGGTQDNGTLRYSGGTESHTETFGSDGGYCAADQTDSDYFYGEKQNMGVFRSSNGGVSAVEIHSGILDRTSGPNGDCDCNFIAPIALDPNEPNRLLAGGKRLWRTNNARAGTPTWASIKAASTQPISAITVKPGDSDFILVGHNNGDIYLTTNGTNTTPTWSKIDPEFAAFRMVTRLMIDTAPSPDLIYATFGGFSSDNIYRTTNLGTAWTDMTGTGVSGLPDVPVHTIVKHPHDRNLLYIGTEVGIFWSRDGGANWDVTHDGPANVSVDELLWIGGDLIAATHGRGLYRASGGLYVDCTYNGLQFGTFTHPFKTVNAAINALTSYRPIWLKPCNYDEQVNPTTKRFEIRSLGGIARVGTP